MRAALTRCYPAASHEAIELLGEGWDFWVFSAGGVVARCLKRENYREKLVRETQLLSELAPMLPFRVPVPLALCPDGPNGLLMAVCQRVPGIPLRELERQPGPNFGAALGRFLQALHAFPVDRARALGLEYFDGERARELRISRCQRFRANIFPMLTERSRTYTAAILEAHIGDSTQYIFEPRLAHADIDDRNVLADPETGQLTGVIDFTDMDIHSPVGDFSWAYCGGFARLGIEDQLPDLLHEGGVPAGGLYEAQLQSRREFLPVWFALHDIDHGLDIGDEQLVREGIQTLNALAGLGAGATPAASGSFGGSR